MLLLTAVESTTTSNLVPVDVDDSVDKAVADVSCRDDRRNLDMDNNDRYIVAIVYALHLRNTLTKNNNFSYDRLKLDLKKIYH